MSRSRFYGACLLITLLVQAGASSRQEEGIREPGQDPACTPLTRSRPPERRDIVLVVSDTMRRDRMGIYGGSALTPSFDALASSGLVFTAAETQAPWTKPSIATLFTGLMPSHHGVVSHPLLRRDTGTLLSDILVDEHTTLAESLTAEGYETAAFVGNPWIQKRLGFGQGFDSYQDDFMLEAGNDTWEGVELETRSFYSLGEEVTDRALEILNEWNTTRQFLWVHYFDAHEPYGDRGGKVVRLHQLLSVSRRRPDAVPLALQQAREAYERDLAAMDRSLDRLWQRLQSDMSVIETHVIVATDHGESFGERGSIGHGHRVSPEIVHVPFFIVSPAFPPKLRQDATGSVDVFDTLLGLARIEDSSGQGRDLCDARGDEFGLARGLSRDVPEPYRDIRTMVHDL